LNGAHSAAPLQRSKGGHAPVLLVVDGLLV
jgi:hypothetical protein